MNYLMSGIFYNFNVIHILINFYNKSKASIVNAIFVEFFWEYN